MSSRLTPRMVDATESVLLRLLEFVQPADAAAFGRRSLDFDFDVLSWTQSHPRPSPAAAQRNTAGRVSRL